jgi:hypothetical protein
MRCTVNGKTEKLHIFEGKRHLEREENIRKIMLEGVNYIQVMMYSRV